MSPDVDCWIVLFYKLIIFLIYFTSVYQVNAKEPLCGDWTPYKDETCFTILDDTFRSFSDAKQSCEQLRRGATLPIIHSEEVQQFLVDYLFKSHQNFNNFWLGARWQNQSFRWIDGTSVDYSNWISSSDKTENKTDHCVEIESDDRLLGKWIDEPCNKLNRVLCQRPPAWSMGELEQELIKLRKQLEQYRQTEVDNEENWKSAQKEFQQFRADSQKTIDGLNQQFMKTTESLKIKIDDQTQELKQHIEEAKKTIDDLKQTLEDEKVKTNNLSQQINQNTDEVKKSVDNLTQKVVENTRNSKQINETLNLKLEKNSKSFQTTIDSLNQQLKLDNEKTAKSIENLNLNMKNNTESTKKSIAELSRKLTTNSGDAKKICDTLRNEITENNEIAEKKIQDLKQTMIPIGFLYTQLPNEKPPSEIWPWMEWTDVSESYANVFFRVTGDQTSRFGEVQEENVPRVTQAEHMMMHRENRDHVYSIDFKPDEWTEYIVLSWVGESRNGMDYMRFFTSGGEVRPRNMAVLIWKRTA